MQLDERVLMRIGQDLGLKAGLVVSWFYLTLVIAWLCSQEVQTPTALGRDLLNFGIFIGFILVCGCVVGVLPAAVIGALTGRYLAILVTRLYARLSPDRAILLGVLVCSGIALAGTGLFWLCVYLLLRTPIAPLDSFTFLYYFLLGVPSIFYIVIGGWGGARLYQVRTRQTEVPGKPKSR